MEIIVNSYGKMDLFIKDNLKIIQSQEMVNINGQMVVHIQVVYLMVNDMVKVITIVLKIKVNIMVSLKMVLNMDMECYSLMNNHIMKDIFIKDLDMEKEK